MHYISLYVALSLHNCSSSGSLVFTCLGSINKICTLNNNPTDSSISYRGIYFLAFIFITRPYNDT